MRKITALLVTVLAVVNTASADKVCLQTSVNKKTFKVTNKSVVAATCPKGYTELADSSKFQGPAGAQGPTGARGPVGPQGLVGAQGPAGLLNLWSCRFVQKTCNHSAGINTCDANCADDGEFVLQHWTAVASPICLVSPYTNISSSLTYENGLSAGIRYLTNATCNYTASVSVLCCPTS